VLLSLEDRLEELDHLGELDLPHLGASQEIEEALRIEKLLGNDRVGLTEGADPHGPGIDLHHLQQPADGRWHTRPVAIEFERQQVEMDQIELSLQVVPEADHFGSPLLLPTVGYLLVLVGVEPPGVELAVDVAMDG